MVVANFRNFQPLCFQVFLTLALLILRMWFLLKVMVLVPKTWHLWRSRQGFSTLAGVGIPYLRILYYLSCLQSALSPALFTLCSTLWNFILWIYSLAFSRNPPGTPGTLQDTSSVQLLLLLNHDANSRCLISSKLWLLPH